MKIDRLPQNLKIIWAHFLLHFVSPSSTYCNMVLQSSWFVSFIANLCHFRSNLPPLYHTELWPGVRWQRLTIRHVKFGIQIGSDWPPNGTNLGLFKISFSTFWGQSDPIWMPKLISLLPISSLSTWRRYPSGTRRGIIGISRNSHYLTRMLDSVTKVWW